MNYVGYIHGLFQNALQDHEITIPVGTVIRIYNHPLNALRILDAHTQKFEGQVPMALLEEWKAKGGPNVSLSGESSAISQTEIKVKNAVLFNGSVAHKINFHAVFGNDKAALFEEENESYILTNPMVAWQTASGVYMVDVNDIPEIVEEKVSLTRKPQNKNGAAVDPRNAHKRPTPQEVMEILQASPTGREAMEALKSTFNIKGDELDEILGIKKKV